MAITAVGSAYTNYGTGTTLTVTSVNPSTIGNVLAFATATNKTISPASVSTISFSGVTTWNRITGFSAGGNLVELWYGVVTSLGSATLTITYTASSTSCGANVQEFSGGGTGTWVADAATGGSSFVNLSSGNYPSITPGGSGELMLGVLAGSGSNPFSGSSSGYTYQSFTQAASASYCQFAYNPSASGAQSPNWTVALNTNVVIADGFLIFNSPVLNKQFFVRQAVNRAAFR